MPLVVILPRGGGGGRLQRAAEVLVDVAADIAVEVREQDAPGAQSHRADRRRRLAHRLRTLSARVVLVTRGRVGDYVHSCCCASALVAVSLT